jgi:hypothetical protein
VRSEVQARARELSKIVKGFFIDHVSSPEYLCVRGHRVLAERSVCLVELDPAISKESIQDWFGRHGLTPSNVFKDNKIRNAKALGPVSRAPVSWIVEYADSPISFEPIDYTHVEKALLLRGQPFTQPPLLPEALVIQRVRKKSPAGRFSAPWLWGEKVIEVMVAMGKLKPPSEDAVFDGVAVEFCDGTPLAGHSTAFNRIRILCDAISGHMTKFERVFEIVGSETKGFRARVLLTNDERETLEGLLSVPVPRDLTLGQMRLLFQKYLTEHGLRYKHENGCEVQVKVSERFVTGDAKGLNGYL